MYNLSDLEISDRLDSLKTKKRELKRQISDLDTQIIGYEEEKRNRYLKNQHSFTVLTEISGEE